MYEESGMNFMLLPCIQLMFNWSQKLQYKL